MRTGKFLFQRFRDSTARVLPSLPVVVLTIVFVCGPIYSLTWYFEFIDSLSGRISLTALVSILPITVAFTHFGANVTLRKKLGEAPWLVAFLFLANGLAASDRFNWVEVGLHTVLLIVALPYCWVIWKLIGRNWLIWTALFVGIVEMMVYWIAALVAANEPDAWRLLLVPLLLVVFLVQSGHP